MDDAFRMGKAHVEDVKKVLGVLAERATVPIYLVGTSRGTLSGAALGETEADAERVDEAVLAAEDHIPQPGAMGSLARSGGHAGLG